MKTLANLLICFLSIPLAFAQHVIENPDYETKNSSFPEIIKIENHPDKSILYFQIIAVPGGWVRINQDMFVQDSENGGQEIMTIAMIGGEFGKQINFPATGSGDTILGFVYPPIPKDWKKMDWKSHGEGSWAIYGIALDGSKKTQKPIPHSILQWLNEPVANAASNKTTESFFRTDTTYLKGYIHGYDTRLGFNNGMIYYENDLYQKSEPVVFQIKSDGRYEAKFLIDYPSTYALDINNQIAKNLYFEPGKTTSFSVEWDDVLNNKKHPFFIPFEYHGENATTNKGFEFVQDKYNFDWNEYQAQSKTLTPDEFKKKWLNKIPELEINIKEFATDNKLSEKDSTLIQHYARISVYESILNYEMERRFMTNAEEKNIYIPLPRSFYTFLKDVPANDTLLLSVPNFKWFVNRLEFSNPISNLELQWLFMKPQKPDVNFHDFLKTKKIPLNEEQEKAFTLLTKDNALDLFISPTGSLIKGVPSDSIYSKALDIIDPLFSQYPEIVIDYQQKYTHAFEMDKERLTILREVSGKRADIAHQLGVAPSILYDVIQMRSLHSALEQEFKNKQEEALQLASFTSNSMYHPYMKEKALNLFLEKFPAGGKQAYTLPEGKGTDIFKKLIEPYKGKLILVDFWATSCGPCIAEIKRASGLRDELEGNTDVAFVFITDALQSPKNTYENFVKENKLDKHGIYYISNEEFLYLRELFKFNGIPRYVLIDKNGDVIDDNYKPYNFRADIEKYMTE